MMTEPDIAEEHTTTAETNKLLHVLADEYILMNKTAYFLWNVSLQTTDKMVSELYTSLKVNIADLNETMHNYQPVWLSIKNILKHTRLSNTRPQPHPIASLQMLLEDHRYLLDLFKNDLRKNVFEQNERRTLHTIISRHAAIILALQAYISSHLQTSRQAV